VTKELSKSRFSLRMQVIENTGIKYRKASGFCNHPLLSLRLSYWVIARSQLHGYLRPRKIGHAGNEFVLNEGLLTKGSS